MHLCLSILLVITLGYSSKAQSASEIKASITKQNAYEFVGLGGRYGYMVNIVSKKEIIESDHFPPKSVYRFAQHTAIRDLDQSNMAAVSLRYDHHRKFITTNNPVRGSAQEAYINGLQALFAAGNYYEAINRNIGWYNSNPDRDGNPRNRFDQFIKVGIIDALNVHVINGLITPNQRDTLIRLHSLNVKNPVMTTILNLPQRDRARALIEADIQAYARRVG